MIYDYIDITNFWTGCLMSMKQIQVPIYYETSMGEYVIFDNRIRDLDRWSYAK